MRAEELAQQIQELPAISPVAIEINREIQKESLTAGLLSMIIAKDPALAAKTLQLANSAYYGLTREVNTLDRAVAVLGFNTIKSIAITLATQAIFKAGCSGILDLPGLWLHSLGCAAAARKVALTAHPHLGEEAFLCGLLHDIGQIAIASNLPDQTTAILALTEKNGLPSCEAEKEIIGFSHEEVGAMLADRWRFPRHIVFAIRHHHDLPLEHPDATEIILAKVIFIGDQLAKSFKFGRSVSPHVAKIPRQAWEPLGIVQDRLPQLERDIRTEFADLLEIWQHD